MSFIGVARTSSIFISGNFLAIAARIAASAALAGAAAGSAAATEVAASVANDKLANRHNNSFFMRTLVTLADSSLRGGASSTEFGLRRRVESSKDSITDESTFGRGERSSQA